MYQQRQQKTLNKSRQTKQNGEKICYIFVLILSTDYMQKASRVIMTFYITFLCL